MKKLIPILLSILTLGMLTDASNGVATVQSADRTGSPVATNGCTQCHGGSGNTTINVELKDGNGNVVTEYEPGANYIYEVVLENSTLNNYGFQTVALVDSDDSNAGALTANSTNMKTASLNSRTYGEHDGISNTGTFVMDWTAPAEGTGDVSFYANGIAANSNGATSGDVPTSPTSITVTEAQPVSSEEFIVDNWSVYPNPVQDELNIQHNFTDAHLSIYTLTGKKVLEQSLTSDQSVKVDHLESGFYIVNVFVNNQKSFNKKILIQ